MKVLSKFLIGIGLLCAVASCTKPEPDNKGITIDGRLITIAPNAALQPFCCTGCSTQPNGTVSCTD